jgi:hypothetical protein
MAARSKQEFARRNSRVVQGPAESGRYPWRARWGRNQRRGSNPLERPSLFVPVSRVPRVRPNKVERQMLGARATRLMIEVSSARGACGPAPVHAEPAVALRALERVDSHRPSEERRPIDARGHGVQQAAKQPVPVVDGDDMGGEDRDRREHGAALALRRDAFTFPWRTPAPRRHVRSFGSVSSRLPRPRVRLGRSARMGLLRCR